MGYLDNTSVTVDAVLTKLGRERLSNGTLDITKFCLGDDEINYALYDTSHNLGSAYYGEAIERMPVLEAFTNDVQSLKYKLVTLPKNTQVLPVITVAQSAVTLAKPGNRVTINPQTDNVTQGNASGYSFTIGNSDIVRMSTVESAPVAESPVQRSSRYSRTPRRARPSTDFGTTATGNQLSATVNGGSVQLQAYSITQTTTTTLTITGIDTGGTVTIPITVNRDTSLD
tara:strand:+ start:1216 stop:1899 length:684 start_codon:yes stop_codon:yes gene_type:complete